VRAWCRGKVGTREGGRLGAPPPAPAPTSLQQFNVLQIVDAHEPAITHSVTTGTTVLAPNAGTNHDFIHETFYRQRHCQRLVDGCWAGSTGWHLRQRVS